MYIARTSVVREKTKPTETESISIVTQIVKKMGFENSTFRHNLFMACPGQGQSFDDMMVDVYKHHSIYLETYKKYFTANIYKTITGKNNEITIVMIILGKNFNELSAELPAPNPVSSQEAYEEAVQLLQTINSTPFVFRPDDNRAFERLYSGVLMHLHRAICLDWENMAAFNLYLNLCVQLKIKPYNDFFYSNSNGFLMDKIAQLFGAL